MTALTDAIIKNDSKKVRELLKDPNLDLSDTTNQRAIRLAATRGHHEILEILLQDERFHLAIEVNSALWHASTNGHDKAVAVLLQNKHIDPSRLNDSIGNAVLRGHDKVVALFLNDGRATPTDINNALVIAAQQGHEKVF